MLLIDNYTRYTWVTFLREKSEALDRFKVFKAMVENEVNLCLLSEIELKLVSEAYEDEHWRKAMKGLL